MHFSVHLYTLHSPAHFARLCSVYPSSADFAIALSVRRVKRFRVGMYARVWYFSIKTYHRVQIVILLCIRICINRQYVHSGEQVPREYSCLRRGVGFFTEHAYGQLQPVLYAHCIYIYINYYVLFSEFRVSRSR